MTTEVETEVQGGKSMKITFRDKQHFYKIVHWLNKNAGKGKSNWTIHGKVLKNFRGMNPKPITRSVIIHNDSIDTEDAQLYLTLI